MTVEAVPSAAAPAPPEPTARFLIVVNSGKGDVNKDSRRPRSDDAELPTVMGETVGRLYVKVELTVDVTMLPEPAVPVPVMWTGLPLSLPVPVPVIIPVLVEEESMVTVVVRKPLVMYSVVVRV